MKRSIFRLLAACFSIMAIALFAGSVMAQGKGGGKGGGGGDPPPTSPFNYQIEYVDFHAGNNGRNSKNDDIAMVNDGSTTKLIIVGRSVLVNGQTRGFVYDHQTREFFDVPVLLGLNETIWVGSACRAINENGIVVGWVKDVDGIHHGFWFDLLAVNPILNLLETDFPEIVSGTLFYAKDVNANGEILVNSGWVVNIDNSASQQLPEALSEVAINDFGDVVGVGANGAIRYNIHTTTLEEMSGPSNVADINNLGDFCGNINVNYRPNRYRTHAFRWGFGNQYDWLSDPSLARYSTSLNDSGDVVGQTPDFAAFLHYSKIDANGLEIGNTYLIKNLVNDAYLNSADLGFINVTERDATLSTPAPIIVGNAEGAGNEKMFVLIPQ